MISTKKLLYKIVGIVGKPHVIESGLDSTTSCRWRKWSDGTAECWKSLTAMDVSFSASGSVYYKTLTGLGFPANLFDTAPTVTANVDMGNVGAASATNITKTATNITILSAVSTTRSLNVGIHAVGTWNSNL